MILAFIHIAPLFNRNLHLIKDKLILLNKSAYFFTLLNSTNMEKLFEEINVL